MAKIEKTEQIDHYLDQIDKKQDSSLRKKVFLFVGLLLLSGVSYVAYSQFSNKNSFADSSASINTYDNEPSGVSTIVVNNEQIDNGLLPEDDELDPELNPELNPEDENADADNALAEEIAARNEANDRETASNNQANGSSVPSVPRAGISTRTFTADELGKDFTPKGGTSTQANKNVAPSKSAEDAAKAKKAEEDKIAAKKAAEDEAIKKAAIEAKATEKAEEERIAAEKAEAERVAKEEEAKNAAKKTSVIKDPSYPGGEGKMRQFFARKISYPDEAINNRVEGNVNVRIKVDEKGRIVDSQVVKGIGAGCDREVLKAINKMPKWNPAEKDGEPVSKYYLLSVAFKLPN